MSELWRQFVQLLLRQGYSTSDLSFCTEDVFRSLLRQTGFTSSRAIDQLVHEWQQHLEHLRTDGQMYASPQGKSTDKLHLPELTQYNMHDIALMAMQLLQRHVSLPLQQKITVREAQVESVTSWTSPYANKVLTNFANEVANMPNNEIRLLWKLCSPVTIANVQQMLSIDNTSDTDSLCNSGVVLYDANKPITRLNTLTVSKSSDSNSILSHLAQLAESGWGLVAFDVAPGQSRVVHSAEVRELGNSLHRFTMPECRDMLKEARFDSFVIPAVGATIVCNAHQLLPRYIVYFSVEHAVTKLNSSSSSNTNKITENNNTPVSSTMASTQAELTAPYESQAEMSRTHIEHHLLREAVNNTRTKQQQKQLDKERQHEQLLREEPQTRFAQNYSAGASPKLTNLINAESNINNNNNNNIVSKTNEAGDAKSFDAFLESSEVMCTIHPQKHVEFWSPSEHRLLCSLCLYFDGYSRANCVPIDQAVREQVPRLQRWLQNAQTFQQEVSGVFELFRAAIDDIGRNEQEMVSDIREQFRSIHTQLEELEKKLCNECHVYSLKQQQQMQLASDEVGETVEEVNELVKFIDGPLTMYKQNLYNSSNNRNKDNAITVANTRTAQITVYAKLLQGAQSAFKKWAQVELPSYTLLERKSNLLSGVHDVLRNINIAAASQTCKGNVELPGAIDVNSLCDSV